MSAPLPLPTCCGGRLPSTERKTAVPNRLATEESAYLRHHGEQPVDWYPWGAEAFARAQREDKPILLSIGYEACHWCHVMARESFADEATAALMNEGFINVKVDREERPDVDQLYQQTHIMLRRNGGGWPLTVFLSPQGVPFYSGTYFPHEAQSDLPALRDILASVGTVWRERRPELIKQDKALIDGLIQRAPKPSDEPLDATVREHARSQLAAAFDSDNGGFGIAPKFPHPTDLSFLLRRARDEGDEHARHMALFTLHKMAEGGLYDHIGGGFFRYSVDTQWVVPHFEKMLCDNALMLGLYADALRMTDSPLFREAIEGTVGWVLREMLLPSGGFQSTLPADDAEGMEGGAYVWEPDAIRQALIPNEWDLVAAHWGLIYPANVGDKHWHLRVMSPTAELARTVDYPEPVVATFLASARAKLLVLRDQRKRPELDEQVLTSWHALMITGLVQAAQACSKPDWLAAARAALSYLQDKRWSADSSLLLATPTQEGFLDDHAFLLEATLALHEAAPEAGDLPFAKALADTLLAQFEDPTEGGFFFTRNDAPPLFYRLKLGQDTATHSGNGTAALALQALSRLTDEVRYAEAAKRCVRALASTVRQDPTSHTRLLLAAQAV
jgi:uncharacterized protein YyaL (SSP411 family)